MIITIMAISIFLVIGYNSMLSSKVVDDETNL